jgi:hypothetical protein
VIAATVVLNKSGSDSSSSVSIAVHDYTCHAWFMITLPSMVVGAVDVHVTDKKKRQKKKQHSKDSIRFDSADRGVVLVVPVIVVYSTVLLPFRRYRCHNRQQHVNNNIVNDLCLSLSVMPCLLSYIRCVVSSYMRILSLSHNNKHFQYYTIVLEV